MVWKSWNGNILHQYEQMLYPQNIEQLSKMVPSKKRIRVVGSARSSSDICAGTEYLASLEKMAGIVEVDSESREIECWAGTSLAQLISVAAENSMGFGSLPDIDEITVGGAIATGTHGTGRRGRPLSDWLCALTLVQANGSILPIDESDPLFDAYRCSLGILGVIASVRFRLEPLEQFRLIEEPMDDSYWLGNLEPMYHNHRFLRLLWLPHCHRAYVIRSLDDMSEKAWKQLVEATPPQPQWITKRRAASKRLYGLAARIPQLTPHINRHLSKRFFAHTSAKEGNLYEGTVTKSRAGTLELAEWSIPLSIFPQAFERFKSILSDHRNGVFAHIPMDIRFLQGDRSWIGNAQETQGPWVTMGLVCRVPRVANRYKAFDAMERVFADLGGRPHWAKHHTMVRNQLSEIYPKFSDFVELRRQVDPQGRFLNSHLSDIFG